MRRFRNIKKQIAQHMRENPTPAEQTIWEAICSVSANEGWDVDRQVVISGYIADIFIRNKNVVVEVDGKSHERQQEWDANRQSVLNRRGIRVFRISNDAILANPKAAVSAVREFVENAAPLYYLREFKFSRATAIT